MLFGLSLKMAAAEAAFFEIFLVVVFGRVKFCGRDEFGDNRGGKFMSRIQGLDFGCGCLLLLIVEIKYCRTVLSSDIRSLAIKGRGIVVGEEDIK